MKFPKILLTVAAITCISSSTIFAAPAASPQPGGSTNQEKSDTLKKDKEYPKRREVKDPIKNLETRKEKIQTLLKEGKISKEKADELTAKVDARIKEINEFNKLTLAQKKERLTTNLKASLAEKVKEGELTQADADKVLEKFTKKIENWDGKGYPKFHGKGFKQKKHGQNESLK